MHFTEYAVFIAFASLKTRSSNLSPFGTWLPAVPGGYSGQAAARFVHLWSLADILSVSICTAIFRTVATVALRDPALASSRTTQLFKGETR